MNILLIAATHGNELLGIKLYDRLLKQRSPLLEHIDFLIGNPRAYASKVRYIDSDLNRSYQGQGAGYEAARAEEIKAHIAQTKPDLIIDMHTTTCVQPVCLIVPNIQGEMRRRLLHASHITRTLQVEPMGDIATLGDNVVGYEVPNRDISPSLLDAITADLERYIRSEPGKTSKQLFVMESKIYKKDVTPAQAKTFVNFEMNPLGFVPIMTGNNSYKKQTDYLGFKSRAGTRIEI